MIHPNMATMLGLIATDVRVEQRALQQATSHAVQRSFNAISVDGDTSTNDTVVVLASGLATLTKNQSNTSAASVDADADAGEDTGEAMPLLTRDSPDFPVFQRQLTEFAQDLAKLIVRGMQWCRFCGVVGVLITRMCRWGGRDQVRDRSCAGASITMLMIAR